jgi:hypothetical protein
VSKFLLSLALLFVSQLVAAQECPWMADSRIDEAFPDGAPWSVMEGAAGQGRCKWLSDSSRPSSQISLIQMIKGSPAEAEEYVKKVGGGMAKSYLVKPEASIGKEGVAVRQNEAADSRMLTLIGHRGNEVIMTQMSFYGGVNAQQQAEAIKLTVEMFGRDTGGGLVLPSR